MDNLLRTRQQTPMSVLHATLSHAIPSYCSSPLHILSSSKCWMMLAGPVPIGPALLNIYSERSKYLKGLLSKQLFNFFGNEPRCRRCLYLFSEQRRFSSTKLLNLSSSKCWIILAGPTLFGPALLNIFSIVSEYLKGLQELMQLSNIVTNPDVDVAYTSSLSNVVLAA